MVPYLGDFVENATVYIYFNTFTSDDPSASITITALANADIKVYKDGSITQISTDGATITTNFDTAELGDGVHKIEIDTNVDAAYSVGSDYAVRIEGADVDGGTINAMIAVFSIENRSGLRPTVAGRTLDITAAGEAGIDLDNTSGTLAAAQFAADFITSAKIANDAFLAVNFAAGSLDGKGDWNFNKTGYALTTADWNTGKTGYSLATDGVSAASLASAAVDKIRDGLLPTQNAAFNNLEFLFVAASDNATPVTGAGTMAVTRSIDGGAFGSGTGTGPAEVGNGIYQYDASAADMNGGIITFRFTATSGTPGAPADRFVTVVTGGGV